MPASLLHRAALLALVTATACRKAEPPDAYGNFEATEVTVSSQASGELRAFSPLEGARLARGTIVGSIDTVQLALEATQILAQKQAIASRVIAADEQIGVLTAQLEVVRRVYERTQRLVEQKAATAQQLDQAEREYRTLIAQIEAAKAQKQSVASEIGSIDARLAQIRDRIARGRIVNPESGTVLATFVKQGELVQVGQPLYRIANLDTLTLRAYVAEGQLSSLRLGQSVRVRVDQGDGSLATVSGTVTWIASQAEFTPTPIQTRDERADLVFAVKINVPNPAGALKIGMPADLDLPSASKGA